MKKYLPRVLDNTLAHKLAYSGAVVIRGPKWCGKTETALQQAKSTLFMQNPDERANNLMLAQTKPSLLLRGEKPRLIDEWQEAPQLWDAVRFAVDASDEPGQFMLTGSAAPGAKPQHSGTGRVSFLDMRPMSCFESGDSTAEVSLQDVFNSASNNSYPTIVDSPVNVRDLSQPNGLDSSDSPNTSHTIEGYSQTDIEEMAYLVCRGGWPRAVTINNKQASLEMAYDYLAAIAEEDVSRVDDVNRNATYARIIVREYARCTATQAAISSMRTSLKNHDNELSKDTVTSYISALRNLYVLEDLPAWMPSLHAKARIAATPTRHFVDPSIAVAALGASPELLLKDMSTYGLLFESLCIRDLRVYAQAINGEVFHYKDNTGLEADAVVVLRDGRYGLVEVKMGASYIEEGAHNLHRLANKLDVSVMGSPAFMMVITPGGYAYQRDDGVLVAPITCLAP